MITVIFIIATHIHLWNESIHPLLVIMLFASPSQTQSAVDRVKILLKGKPEAVSILYARITINVPVRMWSFWSFILMRILYFSVEWTLLTKITKSNISAGCLLGYCTFVGITLFVSASNGEWKGGRKWQGWFILLSEHD